MSDSIYRDLARAWRSLAEEARPAAALIAEANDLAVETVLEWLREARSRGYLD